MTVRCMLRCMSATRTQVYLTAEQRRRIDMIVDRDGVTLAEVVRNALDRYLSDVAADPDTALDKTFGACEKVTVPARDEWARG